MTTAVDRAHAAIRDGIVQGRHALGSMLSENALAEELGVSRTPVRAALVRLAEEGWLRVYPKRGALVLAIDAEEARHLTRALQAFEVTGMRDASPAALARTLADLRAQVDEQRDAVRAGDLERLLTLSGRFHRTMAAAAGNRILDDLYERLDDRRALLTRSSGATMLERGEELIREHEQLIARAERAEWEALIGVLRAHMDDTHTELLRSEAP